MLRNCCHLQAAILVQCLSAVNNVLVAKSVMAFLNYYSGDLSMGSNEEKLKKKKLYIPELDKKIWQLKNGHCKPTP